jgi:phage major head subunit gpT-like protein
MQGGSSIDAAKIEAAYRGFRTTFHDELRSMRDSRPLYSRIARVVEVDSEVTTDVWLNGLPQMREWRGPKHLRKLRGESNTIRTKPHEASIEVPVRDIANDRLGLYRQAISDMAGAWVRALNRAVVTVLVNGLTGGAGDAGYDGQDLFDTDHHYASTGSDSQNNKVTGALATGTYNEAWQKYLEFTDENGEPLDQPEPAILVVGTANRNIARKLIGQKALASGESNMDEGTTELVVTPWITGTEWFLLRRNAAAVILHVKQNPLFLTVGQPSNGNEGEVDSHRFMNGTYLYGIEAEYGAAPGLWEHAIGGTGAG